MKSVFYYEAAVDDLERAIELIEAVNINFPQYRVQIREMKKRLKQLTERRDQMWENHA